MALITAVARPACYDFALLMSASPVASGACKRLDERGLQRGIGQAKAGLPCYPSRGYPSRGYPSSARRLGAGALRDVEV